MTTAFSFATATEILFGRGQADGAAARIHALGQKLLLVRGRGEGRSRNLVQELVALGCEIVEFPVPGEPEMSLIEQGVRQARQAGVQAVVALGGGAAIDAGKAIAALVPATRPLMDHLEVVGLGLPLDCPPLPFVAMPSTAGTGAEVTRNAVIGVPRHRRKVSLRDPSMLPRLAIVDPALTDGCPRDVTLASGLDAITQVIEPYVCTRANPMTDALCRDAIPRGLAAIQRLMQGEDAAARDEMAWVSLCGGLALANSGLGAVHGLAGPLGGLTKAPHGAICGVLLPHVLRANRRAAGDPALIARLDQVAGWINAGFGGQGGDMEAAVTRLIQFSQDSGLLSLGALGVDEEAIEGAARAAASSSSMKANPAMLSADDLRDIMRAAG
ncbi:iron-containing alcohol dehydrogenase [Paracoccus seriniphilus]|uniref:Alcohol dehydrogenase, class IV n=1 Tax=Paracoccus seriniphilus TaxID=184748 RepID=A0A239PMY9_9RHOB|nr:iron-containing alcohol dehydrogenase [Paracoccus seriniphilus]SNT68945.1 Alcohol dehydrogenase, class IV [Paracoccus seriniphilus]